MQSSMADEVPNSSAYSPGSMVSSSEAEVCQAFPRASEKSAFSQTCILLNKYLKENGSLGDLRIGVSQALHGTGPSEKSDRLTGMTMDLFPTTHNPVDDSSVSRTRLDPPREMDLFSPHKADSIESHHGGNPALKPAQLTIFYAGKVMVFDNVTTQKASELIQLAGQACMNPNRPSAPNEAKASVDFSDQPAPIPKELARHDASLNRKPQPVLMHDLPIARKASLQRFLAKRKDRISGRGPYEGSGMSLSGDSAAEGKPWLGMGIV